MKGLYLLLASILALSGCGSTSSGGNKFVGHWKETGSHPKTTVISENDGHTYDILIPKRPEIKNDGVQHYDDFRYDATKDVLFRGSGHEIEIKFDKNSGMIQAFVNHRPASDPMKKIDE